jgi:phage terminase large subunit
MIEHSQSNGLVLDASPKVDVDSLLFDKQIAFRRDPAKRKAAICSRRSGKSTVCAHDMAEQVLDNVEGDVAYITLTRKNAKRIMFNPIKRLNEKHGWGLVPNESDLSFKAPNGNMLYCTGAHTEDEVEKLRGLKFKLIVLDEVASFRTHLNYMIEDVLEPTLIDLDGTMVLIGTPSANPHGNYFHAVTMGLELGWSVHKWTILDNPFIPHAERWLKEYKERKGWADDHPVYLREWRGEWSTDTDSLVYKYDPARNGFDGSTLPSEQFDKWFYIIGVDIGFDDAFTICVNAYSNNRNEIYTVDTYKKSGLIPSMMADVIKAFKDKWEPIKIVGDHGGLGKAICEEFNQRYGIGIHPAEKQKKAAYIEIANGDLIAGLVKVQAGSDLALEMLTNQWDPDKPGKEDDRTPNDLCDAWLYSYRECKHHQGEYKKPKPLAGTVEAHELEADEILQREIEAFERQDSVDWIEESLNRY